MPAFGEAIKWGIKKLRKKKKPRTETPMETKVSKKPMAKKRFSASEKRKQKEDKLGKAIIGASVVGGPPAVVGAGYLGQKRRDKQYKDKRNLDPTSVYFGRKPPKKASKPTSKPKGEAPWEEFMGEPRKKASKELKKYMKEKRQRKSDKQNKHIKKPGKGSRKPTDRDKD